MPIEPVVFVGRGFPLRDRLGIAATAEQHSHRHTVSRVERPCPRRLAVTWNAVCTLRGPVWMTREVTSTMSPEKIGPHSRIPAMYDVIACPPSQIGCACACGVVDPPHDPPAADPAARSHICLPDA